MIETSTRNAERELAKVSSERWSMLKQESRTNWDDVKKKKFEIVGH